MSGEVKRPEKSIVAGSLFPLVFLVIWFIPAWYFVYNLIGVQFLESLTFLSYIAESYPLAPALQPTIQFFAAMLNMPPILIHMYSLMFVINSYVFVPVYLAYVVRCVFAWSFDRIVPEKFAELSERFHTPAFTTGVLGIIGAIGVGLWASGWIVTWLNNALILAIVWMLAGLAAALFPYRRKELYQASPAKHSIGPIPLVSIAGAVTFLIWLYMAGVIVSNPLYGPIGAAPFAMVVGLFVAGFVIYYAARWYRRKQGVDLDLIFREIPPE